jgi:hypothetical protein
MVTLLTILIACSPIAIIMYIAIKSTKKPKETAKNEAETIEPPQTT